MQQRKVCSLNVVETLVGLLETAGQSEVRADECNWRLCLRLGCVVQEGGVVPAREYAKASGWVSP